MKQRLLILALLLASSGLLAHGDDDHGAKAPTTGSMSAPRLEAKSEQFELVATLAGGELSILIDRYASNEPLLHAVVEVESGGLKAKAPFHADIGDYALADAAMLKLLAQAGEHPLVFTVLAGQESDLLEGSLQVAAAQAGNEAGGHDHDDSADRLRSWRRWGFWALGGLLALGLLAALWRRRGTRLSFASSMQDGGQA